MSRRSKSYDWLGIETAIHGKNVDEAVKIGHATLSKFDEDYFREFVDKINKEKEIYEKAFVDRIICGLSRSVD